MKGDGKGNFIVPSIEESGFFIPSNGKAIIKFLYHNQYALASSQNKGALEIFKLNLESRSVRLKADEFRADIFLKNGLARQ